MASRGGARGVTEAEHELHHTVLQYSTLNLQHGPMSGKHISQVLVRRTRRQTVQYCVEWQCTLDTVKGTLSSWQCVLTCVLACRLLLTKVSACAP